MVCSGIDFAEGTGRGAVMVLYQHEPLYCKGIPGRLMMMTETYIDENNNVTANNDYIGGAIGTDNVTANAYCIGSDIGIDTEELFGSLQRFQLQLPLPKQLEQAR